MSDTAILKPIYYDGQILDASDLGASVDYARDQLARHARYSHSWGIDFGYVLTFNGSQVTVAAGVAIDGRGRELVLASDQVLDPTTFNSAHVFDQMNPDPWYPVYVRGLPPTPVAPASIMAPARQPTRPHARRRTSSSTSVRPALRATRPLLTRRRAPTIRPTHPTVCRPGTS